VTGGSDGLRPGAVESARAERDKLLARLDFDRAPLTIAWEVTRACAYACLHCRADAQPRRDPRELTTAEGGNLLGRLAAFGNRPILVLTGGDPLMRRDLFELAAEGERLGLRVALTPTATALVTGKRMRLAREAGVRRVAFSVDAADAGAHDRFRGFQGSFGRTLQGMENAAAEGLPLQVNTTVCRLNVEEIERMVPFLERWGVVQWSVFFLVPTGRGRRLQMLSAAEHERVLGWLHDLSSTVGFDIKATAAPQYRRIVAQRAGGSGRGGEGVPRSGGRGGGAPLAGAGYRFADGLNRPAKGVNDGRGFMFVSHRGEVMPSGFLPIAAGDVRRRHPVDVYRRSPLFRRLRDPAALKGRCGRCEFREVCGGSRARAYAVTGDYLEADPSCPYKPRASTSTG
jgi:radical SAM protein